MKRFGVLLFAAVLAFGLLFPQSAFATGHPSDKWDSFCKPDKWPEKPKKQWYGGDCDEIFVKVWLPKMWKSLEGDVKVEVYWSESGKVQDAQPIASGTLKLEVGKENRFTHHPDKSGYYWFKLSKEGKRKALWTKKIQVDCPEQPGEDKQPEPPKNGGEQPGGTEPDDQTAPDDKGPSKGEGKTGEIPNSKSGQGGGELPKTATSHPHGLLIGGLLLLVGAGLLVFRRHSVA